MGAAAMSAAMVFGWTLPFGMLAVMRARVIGDDLCGVESLSAILIVLLATALYVHPDASTAVVLAYAATCAWTDVRARRVYLPVSIAAVAVVVVLAVTAGTALSAFTGSVCLGGFGLALHYGTRRRGFGFGDATNWAIIGASVGVYRGLWILCTGAVIGALLIFALIGLRVVSRSYRVPMALFTFIGAVVVLGAATAGVLP